MSVSILVFPGTNREHDMAYAVQAVTGQKPHLVWHQETDIPKSDLVILPGGFSHGDYLRCGAMACHSPVMPALRSHAAKGGKVFGVCNGFQILTESGLLPGALLRNAGMKFICKRVYLRTETTATPFTGGMQSGQIIRVPVAHGDGNYFADNALLRTLEDNDQIAFRYCLPDGTVNDNAAPNGATSAIAGVYNADKTVLGMMPHPENAVSDLHGNQQGLPLFQSLIKGCLA